MRKANDDMPIGFEMALAKNFCAMKYVSNLPERKRQQVIDKARTLTSKEEMSDYVIALGNSLKC